MSSTHNTQSAIDKKISSKNTVENSTQDSKSEFLSKLRAVFLNAFLLLIPSLIFIVVKVNTVDKTIIWRVENILIFFLLYSVLLSLFVFKPHILLVNSTLVQNTVAKTNTFITFIKTHRWLYWVILALFVFTPWFVSLYQIKVFIYVITFLIFALGLNYTVGYAGILNLGHVMPFAAGAYSFGILFRYYPRFGFFPGLLLGALAGLIIGLLISLITIRLNGDYLAIVTLAAAEIFKLLMNNLDTFTGGARGIPGIPLPTIVGLNISFIQKYILLYYIALALVVASIILVTKLIKSRFGRSWEAVREDSIAAEAMGIDLKKVRMLVFTIGGLYAGVAGTLHASSATYVSPSTAALLLSITVLSIVVLGGMGSIKGVIIGTIIVIMLPEYLRAFALYRMLIYGALLVVMMRYRQKGLIPQTRISYKNYIEDQDSADEAAHA